MVKCQNNNVLILFLLVLVQLLIQILNIIIKELIIYLINMIKIKMILLVLRIFIFFIKIQLKKKHRLFGRIWGVLGLRVIWLLIIRSVRILKLHIFQGKPLPNCQISMKLYLHFCMLKMSHLLLLNCFYIYLFPCKLKLNFCQLLLNNLYTICSKQKIFIRSITSWILSNT